MRELSNSTWCVDKAGKLGLIDSISGSDALFRYRAADGTFGPLERVPLADLVQATASQLPAGHGMAPAELEALGYASAPGPVSAQVAPYVAPKADPEE